jgi:hypothetical protein
VEILTLQLNGMPEECSMRAMQRFWNMMSKVAQEVLGAGRGSMQRLLDFMDPEDKPVLTISMTSGLTKTRPTVMCPICRKGEEGQRACILVPEGRKRREESDPFL